MDRRQACTVALGVSLLASCCSFFCPAAAVKFTRCGLVRALRQHGFPERDMRNWVCLVESESGRDTDVIGGPNSDGSYDYGLFQINDRYWCSYRSPGGACHVRCKDLAQDDIGLASACALKVYAVQGFWAWYGWRRSCNGHRLPDISVCDPEEEEHSVLLV